MRSPSSSFSRGLAPVLVLMAVATGCAGASKATKQDVVFPRPPEKARIRWVKSFRAESDLKQGFWSRIARAFVPQDVSTAITGPTGLALSRNEKRLFAALPHRARVVAIDLESGSFTSIGVSSQPALRRPIGVAVDADDNLYVTDKDTNSVVVFAPDGSTVRTFGSGILLGPTGVAVDPRRQVVYVVNDASTREGRHVIEVFSLGGKHLRTMGGGRSDAPGAFSFPRSLSVSKAGELYVADMLNFRVQVLDPDGRPIRSFGAPGSGFPGQFDKVHSVAMDTFGNAYVADALQGIHILNPKGQPLMLFGRGAVEAPTAVVIDSRNRIYVADLLHAVHVFDLVNTTAADSYLPGSPAKAGVAAPSAGGAAAPAKSGSAAPGAASSQ